MAKKLLKRKKLTPHEKLERAKRRRLKDPYDHKGRKRASKARRQRQTAAMRETGRWERDIYDDVPKDLWPHRFEKSDVWQWKGPDGDDAGDRRWRRKETWPTKGKQPRRKVKTLKSGDAVSKAFHSPKAFADLVKVYGQAKADRLIRTLARREDPNRYVMKASLGLPPGAAPAAPGAAGAPAAGAAQAGPQPPKAPSANQAAPSKPKKTLKPKAK